MLNKIKKIGIFLKKILRPIQTLIILIFFLVGLFLSFFNTPEDIFTLKLYYNSTQQDNTDFSNYLTNEMQNIKGYDEIEAETFLNENKNFDLVSFEQIDNYKFLKKDDSYIVKDKSTNTIQYIEGFKYNKPYDKYEDIVDKSHFEDKFIMKGHSFVSFSTIENFKISNLTVYNKDKGTIGFLNYSYKNNNLIKTEKPDFYIIYSFLFIFSVLLLIDLMSYNKRFNKFLKSQSRKNNSNHFKDINVETKEIKQEEEKEILIKINK